MDIGSLTCCSTVEIPRISEILIMSAEWIHLEIFDKKLLCSGEGEGRGKMLKTVLSDDANSQGPTFVKQGCSLLPWNSTLLLCSLVPLSLSCRAGEFGHWGVSVMEMDKRHVRLGWDHRELGWNHWGRILVLVIFLLFLIIETCGECYRCSEKGI